VNDNPRPDLDPVLNYYSVCNANALCVMSRVKNGKTCVFLAFDHRRPFVDMFVKDGVTVRKYPKPKNWILEALSKGLLA